MFYHQIQSAIEQGRFKFGNLAKLLKIDEHPFLVNNMVEVKNSKAKDKSKVLTSDWTKQSRAVDPKAQISVDELQNHSRYKEGQGSRKPP